MDRNLLLGNGINGHLSIMGLRADDIAKRFAKCLIKASDFFELMFNVRFSTEICGQLYSKTSKRGIESLAEVVYDYIVGQLKSRSINDRMRILDALICCAITAIFYEGNHKLGDDYKIENLPDFSKFKNIYTLNYAEFWDKESRCVYLHGMYDLASVKCNEKEILIYSMERNIGYKGYNDLVEKMQDQYNMCGLYSREIIFSPEFHKKDEMARLGSYPSEYLYPAEDLFLHEPRRLYGELDGIERLEIFGMSPYGDEAIIRKLNLMKNVVVYIYNMESNKETQDWDKKLTCHHEFKDSLDIMKE